MFPWSKEQLREWVAGTPNDDTGLTVKPYGQDMVGLSQETPGDSDPQKPKPFKDVLKAKLEQVRQFNTTTDPR